MSDFPTRWRLVLLDGSERTITLIQSVSGRWIAVLENGDGSVSGIERFTPREALAQAVERIARTADSVPVELLDASLPTRAELVAALRAHVSATDDHEDEDRQRAEAAALRATRELLRRCP